MQTAPAHADEFRYKFSEVPLIEKDGVQLLLTDGEASVLYWQDDGYLQVAIDRLFVEGYRRQTAFGAGSFTLYEVKQDADPALHALLLAALEARTDDIEDSARDRLEWLEVA